jgi:hypothetical protein
MKIKPLWPREGREKSSLRTLSGRHGRMPAVR